MDQSDAEVVERARGGDRIAIGELFSRYWRAARAAAFGVTGELASAEDAAADAFREAWAGLDSLRDPDRFGPWLRTIVVRTARKARRRGPPAHDVSLDELPALNPAADSALERLEAAALVRQFVRELPPRVREAVSLFYFEGYDSDDAARFLAIPPGTFRRRLHEGRRLLRYAADRVLKGTKPMNAERRREIERLERLIDDADGGDTGPLYQALRGALALRPAPRALIADLVARQMRSPGGSAANRAGGGEEFRELARKAAKRLASPGHRAMKPERSVASVAAAIRRALPDFQEWALDLSEAAMRFFTPAGADRERLQALLPPGFAEGQPGAFVRRTRALLIGDANGSVRTAYRLLQDSADQQTFQAGLRGAHFSDVLDLTWMVSGPLDLRSVQELLERLSAAVLPGTSTRFTNYDEPRYRSALQLQLADLSAPAAVGGVLAEWPGRPDSVEAAHVRVFLEPWASVQSGEIVSPVEIPEMRRNSS